MPSISKAATLRIPAIFRLAATWWRRIHFRAQLRADIADAAAFLHDIGISLPEAQVEAARLFWQPVTLTRRHLTSPNVAPGARRKIAESPRSLGAIGQSL
jgi:uncharacterized protein YjiS (DUF1127 family)